MEQDRDFCSNFDNLYKYDKTFAECVINACASSLVARKTVIVPPKSVCKSIASLSKSEARKAIGPYILKNGYLSGAMPDHVYTFDGEKYTVTGDGPFMFNGVKVKVVKVSDAAKGVGIMEADDELSASKVGGKRHRKKKVIGGKKKALKKRKVHRKRKSPKKVMGGKKKALKKRKVHRKRKSSKKVMGGKKKALKKRKVHRKRKSSKKVSGGSKKRKVHRKRKSSKVSGGAKKIPSPRRLKKFRNTNKMFGNLGGKKHKIADLLQKLKH